uniref:Uncharacterized protein n=1 Tax=Nicotiana tabacum TaxID=4097 RepID=A0A1S3ZCA1_TOBAC
MALTYAFTKESTGTVGEFMGVGYRSVVAWSLRYLLSGGAAFGAAVGEAEFTGPDLEHQAIGKVKIIKDRLKTAQSHQKSYSDVRRKDLEFKEDDWVFLKVSTIKGTMWSGNKGKLSPKVSTIKGTMWSGNKGKLSPKVLGDPSTIVLVKTIEVNEELSYEEVPVALLGRQVRKLRNKEIASLKVLCPNQQVEEATWKDEKEMRKKYPHLFYSH